MELELEFEIEKQAISKEQEFWQDKCGIVYEALKTKSPICVVKELANGSFQIWNKFIVDAHLNKNPIEKYKIVYTFGGN